MILNAVYTRGHSEAEKATLIIEADGVFEWMGSADGSGSVVINEFLPSQNFAVISPGEVGTGFGLSRIDVTFVPEPSAMILALGGLLALGLGRRRSR